jgi:protein-tyrosine phosphatase
MMSTRHIPVPGTHNIRDLGGYATPSGLTHWRRVLRADGLHRMTQAGVDQLHALGVRTVIDLRRDHELEAQPNPFRSHPDMNYVHVSLFDQLDVVDASAPRDGRVNVLLGLYCMALAERGEAIRTILTTIAHADGLVLFHCTAGKDRTGVIAALLLALVGVAREDIVADYALTKTQIAPLLDTILANAAKRGEDMERYQALLQCEPETMQAFLDHLNAQHGGVEPYLAAIGVEPSVIARLRARLAGPTAQTA